MQLAGDTLTLLAAAAHALKPVRLPPGTLLFSPIMLMVCAVAPDFTGLLE
jgi:hypothetical protein